MSLLPHWLRKFARTQPAICNRRRAHRGRRLEMESLEDRCTPSTTAVAMPIHAEAGSVARPPLGPPTVSAPAAPSFTTTVISTTEIDLTWMPVVSVASYQINELIGGTWTQIASMPNPVTRGQIRPVTYQVTGLSSSTAYDFEMAASNALGTTWSNPQSATTQQLTINANPQPAQGLVYTPVPPGDMLFGPNGPSYLDVQQGLVGDCWLMASLAEVAARDPAAIRNMFTYDGTTVENGATVGVYTVRFYNNALAAQYVTVDTELPTSNGATFYDHPVNGVLWVALAEKAYAVANGEGVVQTGSVGSNTYAALNAGVSNWGLQAVIGQRCSALPITGSAWQSGQLLTMGTANGGNTTLAVNGAYVVSAHFYALVGYNASTQQFTLYNPWGINNGRFALANGQSSQPCAEFVTGTAAQLAPVFNSTIEVAAAPASADARDGNNLPTSLATGAVHSYAGMLSQGASPILANRAHFLDNGSPEIADLWAASSSLWVPSLPVGLDESLGDVQTFALPE